jgi:hypothetical protein
VVRAEVQLERTLLVQLALIVFDKRTEERLLLARQWLRHRDGRVRRWAKRVGDGEVPPTSEFRSEWKVSIRLAPELMWVLFEGTNYCKQQIITTRILRRATVVLVAGGRSAARRYVVGTSQIRCRGMTASVPHLNVQPTFPRTTHVSILW